MLEFRFINYFVLCTINRNVSTKMNVQFYKIFNKIFQFQNVVWIQNWLIFIMSPCWDEITCERLLSCLHLFLAIYFIEYQYFCQKILGNETKMHLYLFFILYYWTLHRLLYAEKTFFLHKITFITIHESRLTTNYLLTQIQNHITRK